MTMYTFTIVWRIYWVFRITISCLTASSLVPISNKTHFSQK